MMKWDIMSHLLDLKLPPCSASIPENMLQECGISEGIFQLFQSRMKLLPGSTQTNNVNKSTGAFVPSLLSNATFPIMLR